MGFERVTSTVCAIALGLGGNAWAAPNYIVIIADDFGSDKMRTPFVWDGTGSPPNNFPSTPVLTNLGESGLRFTNAWANPACSPTRASLNTGNYTWRNNIGEQLRPDATNELGDVETLAGVLAAAPYYYQTALFGKWHLGVSGSPASSIWTGEDASPGARDEVFPPPVKRGDGVYPGYGYFDGFLAGVVDSDVDDQWLRIHLDDADNWQVENTPIAGADYVDQVEVDAAEEWIADAVADPEGDPWLAVVALAAPHAMQSTVDYAEADVMNDTECSKISDTTRPYYKCLHDTGATPAQNDCTQAAIYHALVECMDERIGEFLTAVAADGGQDQTIVVFMGDNGTPDTVMMPPYSDGAAFHDVGKGTVYQTGVRVPFIMASFGTYMNTTADFITATGLNVTSLVQSWDLYATMIDSAAGMATDTGTDSISLYPCFTSSSPTCAGSTRSHYAETFSSTPIRATFSAGRLPSAPS
jgi:arylsulfatase B